MKATNYFTTSVMARRPYLKTEWIEYVLSNPIRTEVQTNGRIRHWAFISEAGKVSAGCHRAGRANGA